MKTVAVSTVTSRYRGLYETDPSLRVAITDRDRYMLESVQQHRFLTSTHLIALSSGSPQQIRGRLQKLALTKYLTRLQIPRRGPGSMPQVYALANRGGDLLGVRGKRDYTDKNRDLNLDITWPNSVWHTLAIADFMVSLEMACRKRGDLEFVSLSQLFANAPDHTRRRPRPLRWKTDFRLRGKTYRDVGVEADNGCGLYSPGAPTGRQRTYLFPEIDMGTQTIVPERNPIKPSILQKHLCYRALWKHWSQHREQHPFPAIANGWRVPFVTTTPERASKFLEAGQRATDGRGSAMFLYTDFESLRKTGDPLEHVWTNGRGQKIRLVD